jgi:hypothetical protein
MKMVVKIYSVYDKKTRFYGPLLCLQNDGHAGREYKRMFSKEQHPVSQFPDDYQIYCLGSFDDSNGKIEFPFGNNPVMVYEVSELLGVKGGQE